MTSHQYDYDIPVATVVPVPIQATTTASAASEHVPTQGLKHQASSFRIATTHNASSSFNQYQLKQLRDQGYTQGLSEELLQCTKSFPLRYWVVDNSGSMTRCDGTRLINTKNQNSIKMVSCTRWKELQETVDYHAQLSALLAAPTTFRLLNNPGAHVGPQEFSIGDKGPELIQRDLEIARSTMSKVTPTGVTPLSKHIREIREEIAVLAPSLFDEGKRVAIILATDGLPTNQYGIGGPEDLNDFTAALRCLEGLPVWIVVRLCTDEDKVVNFYNNLDSQLELSVEVLDDYIGEAKEVHHKNPWLNYTLPLHRMREMGIQNRLFDLLDERQFTAGEFYDFCKLLFGSQEFENVPEPEVDFASFMKHIEKITKREKKQWNPVAKKPKSLIDLSEVSRLYGGGNCTIM